MIERLRSKINSAVNKDTDRSNEIGVRATLNSYLAAFLVGSYFCLVLLYAEYETAAFAVFAISWVVIPFLALSDHLICDNKRIYRSGIIFRSWAWANARRRGIRYSDIEQVDTQSMRMVRRGGRIIYRYRTTIRGRGLTFVFISSGENYRKAIARILPNVSDDVLDSRSLDLKIHLADPKEVKMKAAFAGIPEADVLENSLSRTDKRRRNEDDRIDNVIQDSVADRAEYLQRLGNELRIAGYLAQAAESLRRALRLEPRNARLIFDFAKCLHSFAAAERDAKLGVRALAALRLAQRYARDDASLLSRIGETYAQLGRWSSAAAAFRASVERFGVSFLATRGLAEAALQDGKLAHVIHQFAAAHDSATTPALRRWANAESEYFENLNSDPDYLELEVSRVSMLETVARSKKTTLVIALLSVPVIFFGTVFEDDLIAQVGIAVSGVAIAGWVALQFFGKLLGSRIPYELAETRDDRP